MKSLLKLQKGLVLATILTAISACTSGPVVQDYPVTANPAEETQDDRGKEQVVLKK